FGDFDDGVDELRATRSGIVEVETVEQRQLLQENWALAPWTGFADSKAAESETDRVLHAGPPARHVRTGQQASVRPPGDVHDLVAARERVDRLGHEPLVPRSPRRFDLSVPIRTGRLGLGQNPGVRVGQSSVGEAAA